MEETSKVFRENNKQEVINKNSILKSCLASISKFKLAIALSFIIMIMTLIVYAGDVIVENGKLNVDGKLFVASSGNVGIGTTGPGTLAAGGSTSGTTLHVSGTANANFIAEAAGAGNVPLLYLVSPDATATFRIGGLVYESNGLKFRFLNEATNTVTRDNVLFLGNSGNVGIGTTGPGALLHLNTASGQTRQRISETAGTDGIASIDFYEGTGQKGILQYVSTLHSVGGNRVGNLELITVGATGTEDIAIRPGDSDSTQVVFKTSGNVGIGTTTPNASLDVYSATANAANIHISENSGVGGEQGGIIWRGRYPDFTLFPAVAIKRINLEDSDTSANQQRLGFYVREPIAGGGLLERMSIRENGNVGIGTTAPGAPLHIQGATGGTTRVIINSGTSNTWHIGTGLSGIGAADFGIYDATGGFNAATFKAGGNLGIGTTNPQSRLQVSGYLQIQTGSGSPPPATDCDHASKQGRMIIIGSTLYICPDGGTGWVAK